MTQSNAQQVITEDATPTFVNGVNLDTLKGTVNAIQEDSGLDICRFRATNQWVDGAHNRSTVTGFYGARQEIAHKQTFHMVADEPSILNIWRQRIKQRNDLTELNTSLLADIGISEAQRLAEISKPFWRA